jgi:hypothetical protein
VRKKEKEKCCSSLPYAVEEKGRWKKEKKGK